MDIECAICMETLSIGQVRSTECGHLFHRTCIRNCFDGKSSIPCPKCRREVFKCHLSKIYLDFIENRDINQLNEDFAEQTEDLTHILDLIKVTEENRKLKQNLDEVKVSKFELQEKNRELERKLASCEKKINQLQSKLDETKQQTNVEEKENIGYQLRDLPQRAAMKKEALKDTNKK